MKFTVKKMDSSYMFIENKKIISLNGYAFIDEFGYTIIIVCGENRRKLMNDFLK